MRLHGHWCYIFCGCVQNPNYYGLQGTSHQHLSDYLSELVESTVHTLEQAQCVAEKNEVDLEPLNLGLISAFYYVKVATIGEAPYVHIHVYMSSCCVCPWALA